MTFKDLQRVIESQPALNQNQLQKLRGKPFWIWDKTRHKERDRVAKGECCFTHLVGLPKKDGIEKPFFDYQKELYKALMISGYLNSDPKLRSSNPSNIMYPFKEKHIWCKKSVGLGVSEFFLRLMAWLCLYNDDYKNSQMVIVTGPNIDLATKLIRRMKGLFADKLGVIFDSKETKLELNGCSIEAYPSNHIDAFRSLTNPKFIFLDELDFLPKFQQEDCRAVAERYIAKSNPFIVMVSTPNRPDGLLNQIEKEPFDTCLYKKFFLDYLWGLGKYIQMKKSRLLNYPHPSQENIIFTDEDGSSLIAIRKDEFYKLITGLRTAVANEYKLDKEQTSYNDIVDAFRLSLIFYKRSKE